MRHFKGERFECDAPEQCCLFCKNCFEVFFDARGPYLFLCEEGHRGEWENCGAFIPEEEEN